MKIYLIDVNLPYRFAHWAGNEYIHQRDIDARLADKDIWEYAKLNHLTIVTKDSDFADRIINNIPPPRVIHIKIGNIKLKEFHNFISKNWLEIINLSIDYKLVNVYIDRIEGVE